MNYPVFVNLLRMQSYQVKGASQVISFWWSLKVFIGCFSDSFPIFGYRRKPYIIGGWVLCIVATAVTISLGNPTEHSIAWPWILCFSLMTFAFIIADVAADSMLTDLAQKEPIEVRGTLQSTIFTIRQGTIGITGAIMSLTFNSKEYGGKFA